MKSNIEGYIFDFDGTLYSLKKVHIHMGIKLLMFYSIRFWKFKELYSIILFRRYRELEKYKTVSISNLIHIIAGELCLQENIVKDVINKWMFEVPLVLIRKYAFLDILEFINNVQNTGACIAIYSDYPVKEKLKVLGLNPNHIFVPFLTERLNELKPSINNMNYIVNFLDLPINKLIYIGDRDDKDKISAQYIGIMYYDVCEFRKYINQKNK